MSQIDVRSLLLFVHPNTLHTLCVLPTVTTVTVISGLSSTALSPPKSLKEESQVLYFPSHLLFSSLPAFLSLNRSPHFRGKQFSLL